MSDLINSLRELSVTLGRFRSDDEVDEALKEAADRIAALSEENERLRKALEPFVKMAGMMPLTHGPNNEPVSDDEPVSVSCCGFYLGDLTASNLNAVFNLEAKS